MFIAFGVILCYIEYLYIAEVIEMLFAWKKEIMEICQHICKKYFCQIYQPEKRAGECRKRFESKVFDSFEIIEIEERACALSKVNVKVKWTTDNCKKESILTFGCVYKSTTEHVAVPWRNNGKWILMFWDIQGLYQ